MTAGEDNTADMDLLSSDDIPSDDVVMSEDAIRSDDLCKGQVRVKQKQRDHQVLTQTGLRIFDAMYYNDSLSYMYYNDLL